MDDDRISVLIDRRLGNRLRYLEAWKHVEQNSMLSRRTGFYYIIVKMYERLFIYLRSNFTHFNDHDCPHTLSNRTRNFYAQGAPHQIGFHAAILLGWKNELTVTSDRFTTFSAVETFVTVRSAIEWVLGFVTSTWKDASIHILIQNPSHVFDFDAPVTYLTLILHALFNLLHIISVPPPPTIFSSNSWHVHSSPKSSPFRLLAPSSPQNHDILLLTTDFLQ